MIDPYDIAKKIASRLDCTRSGSCGVFAVWFNNILLKHNFTSHKIVFGHVRQDGMKFEHIWIELDNGEKIDPTIIQFDKNFKYILKATYYSPEQLKNKKHFELKPEWIKSYLTTSKG